MSSNTAALLRSTQIARHANAVNGLGADAIVMVGDLVDDQVEDIKTIVEPIAHFRAPDGQFFAMGEPTNGNASAACDRAISRGALYVADSCRRCYTVVWHVWYADVNDLFSCSRQSSILLKVLSAIGVP